MCRANFRSKWLSEGGYDEVVKNVVSKLNDVSRLLLEYDDDRAGDFGPLADLPDDKEIVLGLVSSKEDRVETADDIERRIRVAAKHVGIDRLALSTQCGFASDPSGNLVTYENQERKLALVAGVVRRVWFD